jgi:hypothetical protein
VVVRAAGTYTYLLTLKGSLVEVEPSKAEEEREREVKRK